MGPRLIKPLVDSSFGPLAMFILTYLEPLETDCKRPEKYENCDIDELGVTMNTEMRMMLITKSNDNIDQTVIRYIQASPKSQATDDKECDCKWTALRSYSLLVFLLILNQN